MSGVQQSPTNKRSGGKAKSNPRPKMAKSRKRKPERAEYPSIAHGSRKLEEKWRAESDMRTLAETAKILETPGRVQAAKRVAMETAAAAKEAADAVLNVRTTKGE